MSSNTQDITEQAVADYLASHADFFAGHEALLKTLHLPHEAGGAISLIERQVALLREQSETQRNQLEELIAVARENDRLNTQLHQFTLRLMECQGLEGLLTLIVSRLRRDYAADVVCLHLLAPPIDEGLAGRDEFVRDPDAFRGPFQRQLSNGKPFCGRLKDEQRDTLFGDKPDLIGSAVVLPLGSDGRIGILAIGSSNASRFDSASDTSFLQRMAQIIAAALACHLKLDTD